MVTTVNVLSVSALTSIAEAPSIDSIIFTASDSDIAMHAVARASASIQLGAITVALSVVVSTGRPVMGLMVCHVRPADVSL